jgi:hypothetical protein
MRDAADAQGVRVPAGMYFYRLAGVPGVPARKIILVGG